MTRELRFELPSATDTEALGARLAAALEAPVVIHLSGDLGAGKTTLARGFLHALGHPGRVKSPTYTLIEPYRLGPWEAYHVDLYRVAGPGELDHLGLRDLHGALLVVEWPERGAGAIPPADLAIALEYSGLGRRCRLLAGSALGRALVRRLGG